MDNYKRPKGSLISFFSNKVKANGGINLAQGIPGFSPLPPKRTSPYFKRECDKVKYSSVCSRYRKF